MHCVVLLSQVLLSQVGSLFFFVLFCRRNGRFRDINTLLSLLFITKFSPAHQFKNYIARGLIGPTPSLSFWRVYRDRFHDSMIVTINHVSNWISIQSSCLFFTKWRQFYESSPEVITGLLQSNGSDWKHMEGHTH